MNLGLLALDLAYDHLLGHGLHEHLHSVQAACGVSLSWHAQKCLCRILTGDIIHQENRLASRVGVDKIAQVIHIRVDDDPKVIGLVVLSYEFPISPNHMPWRFPRESSASVPWS